MLREYLITTTPIYRRRVERGLDTLPVHPVKPKANEKDVKIAWSGTELAQEIEFRGVTGIVVLTKRETEYYKHEVLTKYLPEEGEIIEDE